VLAALVVTGCGSSNSDARPRHASTTVPATSIARSTTTVDQEAADKAEITATFQGWGNLVRDLEAETTKWDVEKAMRFLDGPALVDATDWVPKWQASGKRAVTPRSSRAHFAIEDLTVKGDEAELRTCEVNDLVTESADGSILDDTVKTHFAIWEARRMPSGWRLWSVTKSWSKDGVAPCGN
jgi:hypothetical protein